MCILGFHVLWTATGTEHSTLDQLTDGPIPWWVGSYTLNIDKHCGLYVKYYGPIRTWVIDTILQALLSIIPCLLFLLSLAIVSLDHRSGQVTMHCHPAKPLQTATVNATRSGCIIMLQDACFFTYSTRMDGYCRDVGYYTEIVWCTIWKCLSANFLSTAWLRIAETAARPKSCSCCNTGCLCDIVSEIRWCLCRVNCMHQ